MSIQTSEVTSTEQVEYRDIEGFPGYRVGSDGSVWSRRNLGCIGGIGEEWRRLADKPGRHGRVHVGLSGNGGIKMTYAHTLVLTAFVGPRPDGMEGCHNNGIPSDNRLVNLRWDTKKGNQADRVFHGTHQFGARNPSAKLTRSDVIEIRKLLSEGVSQSKIGKRFGIDQSAVSHIHRGKTWRNVAEFL